MARLEGASRAEERARTALTARRGSGRPHSLGSRAEGEAQGPRVRKRGILERPAGESRSGGLSRARAASALGGATVGPPRPERRRPRRGPLRACPPPGSATQTCGPAVCAGRRHASRAPSSFDAGNKAGSWELSL